MCGMDNIETAFEWFDFVKTDVGKWGAHGLLRHRTEGAFSRQNLLPPLVGWRHRTTAFGGNACRRGGEGLLEMDVNENPLRGSILAESLSVDNGFVDLLMQNGIGVEPEFMAIEQWRVDQTVIE